MLKLKNIILGTAAALALSTQVSASSTYFGITTPDTSNPTILSSYPSTTAILVKDGAGELDLPSTTASTTKVNIKAGILGVQGSLATVTLIAAGTIKHAGTTGSSASQLTATITTLDTTGGAASISLPNDFTNITATTFSGTNNVTLTAGTVANKIGNTFTIGSTLPAGSESFTINSGILKFPAPSSTQATLTATNGGISIAYCGTADCSLGIPVSGTITMNTASSTSILYPTLIVKGGTINTNQITVN